MGLFCAPLGEEPHNPEGPRDHKGKPECADEREQDPVEPVFCRVFHEIVLLKDRV